MCCKVAFERDRVLHHPLHGRCLDGAGADGVDAHAVGSVICGQRPCQVDDGRFRGRIHDRPTVAVQAADGGRVDDRAAAAGLHRRHGEFGAQVHRPDVHVHYQVPVTRFQLHRSARADRAGVAVEHVEAAPSVHGRRHHRLDVVRLGDVGTETVRLASGLHDRFGHTLSALAADVHDEHRSALGSEALGTGFADARRTACHDRDLVLEQHPVASFVGIQPRRRSAPVRRIDTTTPPLTTLWPLAGTAPISGTRRP